MLLQNKPPPPSPPSSLPRERLVTTAAAAATTTTNTIIVESVCRGTRHLQAAEPRRRGKWEREGAHRRCVFQKQAPHKLHHQHHRRRTINSFSSKYLHPWPAPPNATFQHFRGQRKAAARGDPDASPTLDKARSAAKAAFESTSNTQVTREGRAREGRACEGRAREGHGGGRGGGRGA